MSDLLLSEVDFHLTNRCTSCCHTCCYASNEAVLSELTTEEVLAVVDEAASLGCREFHFTGGEPFLRCDLFDIIEAALGKGVHVRLQTNGIALTRSNAQRLQSIGLRDIMISLDGHTRALCDAIRGPGAFEAAMDGIRNGLEAHLDVRVNAVLTARNISSFPGIVELVGALGVSTCSSFYFTPIGRGAQNAALWIPPREYMRTCERMYPYLSTIRARYDKMNVIVEKAYVSWDEAASLSVEGFRGAGGGCAHVLEKRDYLIIRCDGNVYPCILFVDTPGCLGNVKTETLERIWKGSDGWAMLDRCRAVAECGDCRHVTLCNGGCAGYARILRGAYERPDPRCIKGELVPLCPIMKYNYRNDQFGGSSVDVIEG